MLMPRGKPKTFIEWTASVSPVPPHNDNINIDRGGAESNRDLLAPANETVSRANKKSVVGEQAPRERQRTRRTTGSRE